MTPRLRSRFGVSLFAFIAGAACSQHGDTVPYQSIPESVSEQDPNDTGKETTQDNTLLDGPDTVCAVREYETFIGDNIAAVTLPTDLTHRVIAPNMLVPQDYVPERLNFIVNKDGVITRIHCG